MTDDSYPIPESPRLRVFISYSRDDILRVRMLFRLLKHESDFEPWMDERSLLPGEDWEQTIREQISNSGAVIVCLSARAVDKEGYFQREINIALHAAESKSEGFLIPVSFEECEIPQRLSVFHCVNVSEQWGHDRLMQALLLRRQRLLRSTGPSEPKRNFATIMGVRGWTITWLAVAVFVLGRIAGTLATSATYAVALGSRFAPDLMPTCIFALLVLFFFRIIRNAVGASVASATAYGLVSLLIALNRGALGATPAGIPLYVMTGVTTTAWALLFLLLVSWGVRAIKPWWLGMWACTAVANILGLAISRAVADRAGMRLSSPWWPGIVQGIVNAMAFAVVVWGGQHFMPIGRPREMRLAGAKEP